MYMICGVFQATNLVHNYGQRKSSWTNVNWLELAIKFILCVCPVWASLTLSQDKLFI